MRQDNLDNKIKDIFGSMDDNDQQEALGRKENVWQAVAPVKEKKKYKRWLLILLIGTLLFAAGWFMRDTNSRNLKSPQFEQQDYLLTDKTNQLAIANMEKQISFKEQQLDSLLKANNILSSKLTAMANNSRAIDLTEKKINTIYVRDTLYVTKVKVEQQIVEKTIRDTILIEVPIIQNGQPVMAEANVKAPKKVPNPEQTAEIIKTPSSIQFNFSEATNLEDK